MENAVAVGCKRRVGGCCATALAIGAVLIASSASAQPAASPINQFVDLDGRLRDPEAEYAKRLASSRPGHLLTIGEELLFLGAGTTWYWLDREHNVADWDYPSWEQRVNLEAWRYDNNTFPMNFLAHSLNGAAFYAIPRANGHGVAVSAAYAFATSFAWEYLIEFREKVSINDLIVTQAAGMPIGEFASKLWHYVNGLGPDATPAQRTLAASLGFPVWLKRKLYAEPSLSPGPYDELGFSSAIGRRLGLGYEARWHDWGSDGGVVHGGSLRGRLSSIPGEGRPGRFDLFFHEADVVSLSLFGGFGDRARELEIISDMHLLGWYAQSLDKRGDGAMTTFAASLAFRYRFRDFSDYNDRLGLVHLPGPGVDFSYRAGPAELSTSWRLNADFAGIHSAAYGDWVDARLTSGDRPKSILRKHNYYYGWGVSTRLGAAMELAPVDLQLGVLIGAYDSHEGLDRAQEELSHDPDATDRVLEVDTEVGFTIPNSGVRLGVGWAANERQSQVEGFTVERTLHTVSASLGLVI